jgi:hypothetical protein
VVSSGRHRALSNADATARLPPSLNSKYCPVYQLLTSTALVWLAESLPIFGALTISVACGCQKVSSAHGGEGYFRSYFFM